MVLVEDENDPEKGRDVVKPVAFELKTLEDDDPVRIVTLDCEHVAVTVIIFVIVEGVQA